MHGKMTVRLLLAAALVGCFSCNVLDTQDAEGVAGQGAKAFSPYEANVSGAIRLDLEQYNGCPVIPGRMTGPGSSGVPYPDFTNGQFKHCRYRHDENKAGWVYDPNVPEPTDPIELLTGTHYFLNQLMIMDSVWGLHKDPNDMSAVADWFQKQSPFDGLDWTGLAISSDEWHPSTFSISPTAWTHTVEWSEAAWMKKTNDTFQVDVLDADGNVRGSQRYSRSDFLVQNPAIGHTYLRWQADNIGPPQFPGDTTIHAPADAPPGFPPLQKTSFQTTLKIGMEVSTDPSKQIEIPTGLSGDGAIRITWSQLPNHPFYWPVRFVSPSSLPPTCYSGTNWTDRVPCSFGDDPEVTFDPPKNGTFFVPGEVVHVHFAVKDSNGNYLHPKDHLPSFLDYLQGKSNGIIHFDFVTLIGMDELDTVSMWQVAGPKQDMNPSYSLADAKHKAPFFETGWPFINGSPENVSPLFVEPPTIQNALPGAQAAKVATTWTFKLPADADPGTYTVYLKINRYFMGERFTKTKAFDFQVGQTAKTDFPGQVGNCQICHRGAISLDNVRMGLNVDYVEGCKACHSRNDLPGGRINATERLIHKIHMSSPKYPLPKNECVVCHLTRKSTLRPSYEACGSCHFKPHGQEFGFLETTPDSDPSQSVTVYSDCGSACHANTPPTQHILPAE